MVDLDRFIAALPAREDGDLMLCDDAGIAWQKDRAHRVTYDAAYFDKCRGYEGAEIARKINAGRVELVDAYVGTTRVLDIGIGSGEFIAHRPRTCGFDVNPKAVDWLRRRGLFASRLEEFAAFTFWDVLEHVPDPGEYLDRVRLHGFVFASLPIFAALDRIRESRHYRPGEHLQYFTRDGFETWMHCHGFMLLDRRTFEIDAGRDGIYSYAFKRFKWANPSASKSS